MKYTKNNIIGVQFYGHRRDRLFTIESSKESDSIKVTWIERGQKLYSWYYSSDAVTRLNDGTWAPISPIELNYEIY